MKKLTFKTNKPTGRYRAFDSTYVDIKLDGNKIGSISENPFKVGLMVVKDGVRFKDNNPNCEWKWVYLKREFASFDDAKNFVKENFERIAAQLPLRSAND